MIHDFLLRVCLEGISSIDLQIFIIFKYCQAIVGIGIGALGPKSVGIEPSTPTFCLQTLSNALMIMSRGSTPPD
jgi:hypothetical protein